MKEKILYASLGVNVSIFRQLIHHTRREQTLACSNDVTLYWKKKKASDRLKKIKTEMKVRTITFSLFLRSVSKNIFWKYFLKDKKLLTSFKRLVFNSLQIYPNMPLYGQ